MPHSAGDLAPAGGGRYLPSVLNTWPMKPSGVQLARPIWPLGLQTRNNSAAARSWFGVNITPKVESTVSKLLSSNGRFSASASRNSICHAFRLGAGPAALQQRRHVVGRGDVAPAPRGGEAGHAVAGGDVEHLRAGLEIERLAELLADDLQRRADDGVIARRPRGLLFGLECGQIGARGGQNGGSGLRAIAVGRPSVSPSGSCGHGMRAAMNRTCPCAGPKDSDAGLILP